RGSSTERLRACEDDGAIGAAEAEGVAEHAIDARLQVLLQVARAQGRIRPGPVEPAGREALLDGDGRDDGFEYSGRAKGVPGGALGGADRYRVAEDAVDRLVLGRIVV